VQFNSQIVIQEQYNVIAKLSQFGWKVTLPGGKPCTISTKSGRLQAESIWRAGVEAVPTSPLYPPGIGPFGEISKRLVA